MAQVWGIVCAGGNGSRAGGIPKQYRKLGGASVLERSIANLTSAGVAVVVVTGDPDAAADAGVDSRTFGVGAIVRGGAERRDSVAAGLEAVPEDAELIVVHDAARPFAPPDLVDLGIDAIREGADAAVPAVETGDTVKEVSKSGAVVRTLDRSRLVRVQTPQVFAARALRRAHANFHGEATDDAAMVEATGGRVVVFPGDPLNLKITYSHDLAIAATILEIRGQAPA